jgi:hypothetical protein
MFLVNTAIILGAGSFGAFVAARRLIPAALVTHASRSSRR